VERREHVVTEGPESTSKCRIHAREKKKKKKKIREREGGGKLIAERNHPSPRLYKSKTKRNPVSSPIGRDKPAS
jgi:hypothetical protein